MNDPEAEETILEHFESKWEALHPANQADPDHVPWTTRNEVYETDKLGDLGAWVRITVETTSRTQMTQGQNPKYEVRGVVFVQVFAAVNWIVGDQVLDGDKTVKLLVEDVRAVLESKDLGGGLNLYELNPLPMPEDGVWNMYACSVPFRLSN
jgi:hypothetical protein